MDASEQKTLIEGIRDGQRDSETRFYDYLQAKLLPYIRNKIGSHLTSRFDPEDVFHETLTEIISIIRKGDREIKFLDRLSIVVARNVIAGWARRKSVQFRRFGSQASSEGGSTIEPPAMQTGPFTKAVRGEKNQLIETALSELKPEQALIVSLRLLQPAGEKLKFREIGEIVGMTPEASEKAYLRAKDKMRDHFKRTLGAPADDILS